MVMKNKLAMGRVYFSYGTLSHTLLRGDFFEKKSPLRTPSKNFRL